MQKCLLLGVGHRKGRILVGPQSARDEDTVWTTLDINPAAAPDICFDLEALETGARLPVEDGAFAEIHAYEVLEHFGRQGDFRGFFRTFRELWRVLEPGGHLFGTSPAVTSRWVWGDPGHTRLISEDCLSFLQRRFYDQLGKTPASDYRSYIDPCWWELVYSKPTGDTYAYVLKKV